MPTEILEKVPTVPRPQMPSEPPKEVLEINFADDPTLSKDNPAPVQKVDAGPAEIEVKQGEEKKEPEGKITSPVVKEKEEKKELEKKEETKVEDKEKAAIDKFLKPPKTDKKEEVKESEKKTVATSTQIVPPDKKDTGHFDYSTYSPQEADLLKNMSRPAREWAANNFKKLKELEKSASSLYFQSPDAYVLDPTYKQMSREANQIHRELQHNQQQLLLIKAGKPFRYITDVDESGQFKYSDEQQPTDAWEESVRTAVTQCMNAEQNMIGKLRAYPEQYKGMIQNDLNAIQKIRGEKFIWVSQPEYMDREISVDGQGDVPIKNVRQQFISLFPHYLRSNPAVEICADMMVGLIIKENQLKDALEGQKLAEIKKEELQRGEPKSIAKPTNDIDEVHGVKEFSSVGMPTN